MNRGNYIDFWTPLQSNKECINYSVCFACFCKQRLLIWIFSLQQSTFCRLSAPKPAEQILQGSDGNRNSACFPPSIPGMRLCRIPSTFRQGWEESVGSLGKGESLPDMVQWLGDSWIVRNKCHSSQHPRQGGGKLGCQGRDITYSIGQVGWDNRNIHSDDHSDIVCVPKTSPWTSIMVFWNVLLLGWPKSSFSI